MKYSILILASVALLPACNRSAPAEPVSNAETEAAAPAPLEQFDQLEQAALDGDYQAQRNVAYWLTGGTGQPPIDPVAGCAWRIVIVESRYRAVDQRDPDMVEFHCTAGDGCKTIPDQTDHSNRKLYCDRLDAAGLEKAGTTAGQLTALILARRKP